MKILRKLDGSCAVVALLYCSGLDEQTVIRVCQLHGFEAGQGMEDIEWKYAAKDLNLKIRSIPFEPCRLRKFLKCHQKGLFLLGTIDHLFVIDNGIVVDPRNNNPPGLDRIIKQAWKVSKGI